MDNEMKLNILILIDSSWGEIDWIAPVCCYIKKNFPNVHLTALFTKLDTNDVIRGNIFLRDLLFDSVHNHYDLKDFLDSNDRKLFNILKPAIYSLNPLIRVFRRLSKNYIRSYFIKRVSYQKIIDQIEPDVLLKETSPDWEFSRQKIVSLARKRGCKDVMFPHSTELYHSSVFPKVEDYSADYILCNTKWMAKLFPPGNELHKNEICVVGIPRYDEWWIQHILNNWDKNKFTKNYIRPNSTVYLFYTRGGHVEHFSEKTSIDLINETLTTVLSLDDSFIIVKPHPRQNLNTLRELLGRYDKSKWIIDQTQAFCLSSVADIVICMGRQSTVFDSLAVKKPVIEYTHDAAEGYADERRKFGLVAPTDNTDELMDWIKRMKSNPDEEKKVFIENYYKLIPKSEETATKKAVDIVLRAKV